jgi:hypothetical protein
MVLGVMQHSTRYALLGFITACVAAFTGCAANRVAVGLGPAVAEAIKPMFEPPFALAISANKFREARKHWPKDYEELSRFLEQSDDKTYKVLQSVQFDRVAFSETPDGKLEISAEYSPASGGTVRIDGMMVSAFETNDK